MKTLGKTQMLAVACLAVLTAGCSAVGSGCRKAEPWLKATHIYEADAAYYKVIVLEKNGYFTYGDRPYQACGSLTLGQMHRLNELRPTNEILAELAGERRSLDGYEHLYLTLESHTIRFLLESVPVELQAFLEVLDESLGDALGDQYKISVRPISVQEK